MYSTCVVCLQGTTVQSILMSVNLLRVSMVDTVRTWSTLTNACVSMDSQVGKTLNLLFNLPLKKKNETAPYLNVSHILKRQYSDYSMANKKTKIQYSTMFMQLCADSDYCNVKQPV